jgi:hypothetical protein
MKYPLSVCIPRVELCFTEPYIFKILNRLQIGNIDKIEVTYRCNQKGDEFNRVFVYYSKLYDNENAQIAKKRLDSGKDIKTIYDELGRFWKIKLIRQQ